MPTQVLYGEQRARARAARRLDADRRPDQPSPLDARGYPGLGALVAARPGVAAKRARRDGADGASSRTGRRSASARRCPPARCPPRRRGALPRDARRPRPDARSSSSACTTSGAGSRAWGYDCSGLTWAVYRAHGITIPRDADAQFAAGTPVALSRVLPGDLLFYEHPVVGHVAMYDRRRADDRGAELAQRGAHRPGADERLPRRAPLLLRLDANCCSRLAAHERRPDSRHERPAAGSASTSSTRRGA